MKNLTVNLIVDPEFGSRLHKAVKPAWIAATKVNRAAAELWWREHPGVTEEEGVTTFDVDEALSPVEWCVAVLPSLDMHFGAYDEYPPRYTAIDVHGAGPTEQLRTMLADNGCGHVVEHPGGFRASRTVAAV